MKSKNISKSAIEKLQPIILFKGNTTEKLNFLTQFLTSSEIGKKGIEEVNYIFTTLQNLNLSSTECELDLTLARGLNYYTGAIFEVKVNDPKSNFTGSICGGGRYDDLTGIFGLPNVSGVGISFGADRIYDVMEELNLFPEMLNSSTKLLVVNFGKNEEN